MAAFVEIAMILLTGFEPFNGASANPSREVALALAEFAGVSLVSQKSSSSNPKLSAGSAMSNSSAIAKSLTEKLLVEILPVSYAVSLSRILSIINTRRDLSAVVMLGQAGGRKNICLERVSLNWADSNLADETGVTLKSTPIDPTGPPAHLVTWPLRDWVEQMRANGVAVEESFSAGTFVCNYMSYVVANELSKRDVVVPSMFVHLPFLPEQGSPSMALDEQVAGVAKLLDLVDRSAHSG